MTKSSDNPIEILLVEDNEGDVILTKIAFKNSAYKNNISVASDGEEAIDFLKKTGDYANVKTPDIILLDLNLPKKNGLTVLKEIKQDPNLRRIPVVVMSSSQTEQDIVKSYDLQASGYVIKPLSLQKFAEVVDGLDKYWFTIVVLPKKIKESK